MRKNILVFATVCGACRAPDPVEPEDEVVDTETPTAITVAPLRAHLEALFDIAMANDGNRAAGTSGYEASLDYVEATLEQLGVPSTRVPFELNSFQIIGDPELTAPGVVAEYGEAWLVIENSGSGDVTARAVGVDLDPALADGSSDSACEDGDFDGFPAGAIAVIQRGTCTFQEKVDRAVAAGASAVVIFNEGQRGRTGLFGASVDGADIPLVATDTATGLALAGLDNVRVAVVAERVTLVQENLIASLPGTTGRSWMLGAHLDSVPAGPGINDNGTGVATVLEVTRALNADGPLANDGVVVAFWGAEEIGLVGSMAWVEQGRGVDEIAGYLNLDMVGSPNPGRFIYDGSDGPRGSGQIEQAYASWYDEAGLPHDTTPMDGRSDYLGFMLAEIPSGGLFTGAEDTINAADAERFGLPEGEAFDACYHKGCDTLENVDWAMLEEAATATLAALRTLDSVEAPSRLTPANPELPIGVHGSCAGEHTILVGR